MVRVERAAKDDRYGDITVDISSIVDPLASGSYYTIVVATGPYGSTSSTGSPAFTK